MDIPYWSMSAAITQDPEERTKVVAFPRTLALVGMLVANVLTQPLVNAFGSWIYVAVLYGGLAVVFTLITFFNVKERVSVPRERKQTIKDVFILLGANRPLRLLILSMLISETINYLRFVFPIYYLKYNLNSESLYPVFAGLYLIVSILGSGLSPMISKRFGKKNTAIWGSIIACISSIGMFFTGYGSFLPVILWSSIGSFTAGFAGIAQTSMLADCVEYGEWKTGNRAEGIVFSTNIFKTKAASAIGGSIGAFVLSAIGFAPNAEQTKFTLDMMHMLFTLVPGILSLIAIIPLRYYDLTEERYKNILVELKNNKGVPL
jgi:GPH family glycoside/pentoside/hexuronide:cation symporter/probable glucitol transport protein GutA